MKLKQTLISILKGLRSTGFSDLVKYDALIEDGVMLMRNGSYLAAWEFCGPDMDSISPHEADSLCGQISSALRLDSGWTLQTDHIREACHAAPVSPRHMKPLSRLIDEERRCQAALTGELAPYISRYFFCLTYSPARGLGGAVDEWVFEDGGAAEHLKTFRETVSDIEASVGRQLGRFPSTFFRRLKTRSTPDGECCDLSSYLRYAIQGEWFPFALPPYPILLSRCFSQNFTGGEYPTFGDNHICTIAIDGFPDRTFAGMTKALETLRFPFRYSQAARLMESEEAAKMHSLNVNRWSAMTQSVASAYLRTTPTATSQDSVSARLAQDASQAKGEAQHGIETYARYSCKLILMDTDRQRLSDRAALAVTAIKGLALVGGIGFSCRIERYHAPLAWISSFPGHAHLETRLGAVSCTNFSHLMPVSAPYRGLEWNPSTYLPPKTPPVFVASAVGGTPFNVHFHSSASGISHTLLTGPSGHGKTTYLAFTIAMWERLHPKAQIFAIDKGMTLYPLFQALGGDFYDLSPGTALRFCPLQDIDTPEQRGIAARYIEDLCAINGLALNSTMRNAISEALLLHYESDYRSLTHFQSLVGPMAPEVREALQFYTIASAAGGGLLDGQADNLSFSRLSAFEVGKLYQLDQKIASAVLLHLFRRIASRFDAAVPTLLTVDELTASLSQPVAVAALEEFLSAGRKQNAEVMLATQSPAHILAAGTLATTMLRECQNRIYLPNSAAIASESEAYKRFGLSEDGRNMVASAVPCQDYFHVAPGGQRMYSLELGDVALAFIEHCTPNDRAMIDRLKANNPATWQADWLDSLGLAVPADLYRQIAGVPVRQPKQEASYA